MMHKKHKLTTLIKIGVISFLYIVFCEHPFFSKDPKYDKIRDTTYIMLMLLFTVLIFILISGIFSKSIMQGGFILYGVIFACGVLLVMIEFFKVWYIFFKERLEKENQ
jgi:hypothetical protein